MTGRRALIVSTFLMVTVGAALAASAPALAEDDDTGLVEFRVMKLGTATALAQAALEECRSRGFQVAVTVVDRFGLSQVVLRDRFAGAHTLETSKRKAWTAVSFRTDTLEFAEATNAGTMMSGIRDIPNVVAVGGGIPVESAGSIVGGVGVSGAPGGDEDHACASVGIESIAFDLEF